MAKYDGEMAERVWKRVQGEQPERNLQALILGERTAASAYRMLARQLGGREREILQRLYREERNHTVWLQGMHMLSAGGKCVIRIPLAEPEPVLTVLRRCYAEELRTAAAYDAHSTDPEFGFVFARMAVQEREHSLLILELLGTLQK